MLSILFLGEIENSHGFSLLITFVHSQNSHTNTLVRICLDTGVLGLLSDSDEHSLEKVDHPSCPPQQGTRLNALLRKLVPGQVPAHLNVADVAGNEAALVHGVRPGEVEPQVRGTREIEVADGTRARDFLVDILDVCIPVHFL